MSVTVQSEEAGETTPPKGKKASDSTDAARAVPMMAPVNLAKVTAVAEAHQMRDLFDRKLGEHQQISCMVHSHLSEEDVRTDPELLAKQAREVKRRQAGLAGDVKGVGH